MSLALRVVLGLAVAAMALVPAPVRADLTPMPAVYENQPCNFKASFEWKPVKAGDTASVPPPKDKDNFWEADIKTVGNAGRIDVNATIWHDTGDGCGGPNEKPIKLSLSDVDPGPRQHRSKVAAGQVSHNGAIDLGILKTTVNTAQGGQSSIAVGGFHLDADDKKSVTASFTNDSKNRNFRTITVTPDYTDPKDPKVRKDGDPIKADIPGKVLMPGQSPVDVPLPPTIKDNGKTLNLTSYRIEAAASPPTTTDLAFLGDVDGTFGELDLAGMLELMLGTNDMLAPYLRPLIGDDTDPLYVAIDLTQWIGLAGSFHIGDVFTLVDGMSDLLPGLLVGRSPITLGADGYHTDDAFNGDVVAVATIDGKVPEPRSVALAALALVVLALARRGRKPVVPAPA